METNIRYTFGKEEKLKHRKEIERLFQEGQSLHSYPLRWVWVVSSKQEENHFPIKMAVSVSKRRFKLAVDRNRVKRMMREAWRLHKHEFYAQLGKEEHYSLMLIYTAKDKPKLQKLEKQLKKGMKIFLKKRFSTPPISHT